AVIEGDADRLSQVLDNILSNAAKYSPSDTPIGVRAFIEPADERRGRVEGNDQGAGIPPPHLPRPFDPFYPVAPGTGSTTSGFGRGLSIVRDLVEAHGGHVEVFSEGPGTGSTFTVLLPIALPLAEQHSESHTLASA